MYFIENDLFKAMHKYIKRTGSPGNYQYWYKLPDGRVVAQDDMQEHGKTEHLKRLIAGRMRGLHTKTNEEISRETGIDRVKVGQHERNLRRPTNSTANDYHETHLKEAHTGVDHADYARHAQASEELHDGGAGASRTRTRSSSPRTRTASRASSESTTSTPEATRTSQGADRGSSASSTPSASQTSERSGSETANQEQGSSANESAIAKKRQKLKELFGIDLGASESGSTSNQDSRTPEQIAHDNETSRISAQVENRRREERAIQENVNRANEQLAQARESERRAREAVVAAASSPESSHASELHSADPTLARDDAAITEMIEAQRRGENPYLNQAKDVFERIAHNVKAERRTTVGHVLSALNNLKEENKPLTEANIVQEYKRLSGKNIRGLSGIADEFEKATFFTLGEVMGNEPINAEVERMKRGYAAKQFARAKPYLKQSWLQTYPSAPPPFPTFGDFKSWSEHGGTKPDWAGTTRLAMPREMFDAAPKGADGKVKYPPAWMPIHLMPVWNYAYKRIASDDAYQSTGTGLSTNSNSPTGWNINMGDQAQFQEGMIKASIRKYVQMRGGRDQLTDIPKSKLTEAGLTHADIYKSEDVDSDLHEILRTKIIDPVALLPFLKAEMQKGMVKKSINLIVDKDLKYVPKSVLLKAEAEKEQALRKSLIEELKKKFQESKDKRKTRSASMGVRG